MRAKANRLLDKLSKYAKTDMHYLAKGGFWLGVGHAAELLGGLIITILLANLIAKENLGLYQFVISTATILGAFTLTGLALTVITETAKGNEGALKSGVKTKFKWNLGILISSFLVSSYYFINDNQTLAVAFLIVGSLSPFIESFHLYQPFLIGKQAFKFNAFLSIVRKAIPMLGILGTLYFTEEPIWLITAYFLSNTITMLLNYFITVGYFRPPNIDVFKDKLLFSKHLSVMQLTGRIGQNIDKVLIFHHLGAVSVATYTIAQLPTKYTRNALEILRSLVLPKVSKRDFPTLQKTLPKKVLMLSILIVAILIIYILLAPFIFRLVFPEYPEAILISQALAFSLLALPRSSYISAMTAHEKTKPLYFLNILGTLLKITMLYFLLPIYGIWGAVYAIVGSEFIVALLSYSVFKRIK